MVNGGPFRGRIAATFCQWSGRMTFAMDGRAQRGWLLAGLACLIGLAGWLTGAGAAQAAQQSLAAHFTITDPEEPEGPVVGRLFMAESGLRIEQMIEGEPAVVLMDFTRNVMIWLDEIEKSYFELDASEADIGWLDWLLMIQEDPCGAAEGENIKAAKLGKEALLGRSANKWSCRYANNAADELVWTVWLDPALPIPLRVEDSTGFVFAIDQLTVGPQPAALFQVPAAFKSESILQD